jgi:hypothetical protein
VTNEPQAKIKFDATINLGHILTFIGFIATGIAMWTTMDKRVVVLEEARSFQTSTDKRQDSALEDNKKIVREDLREINSKLDRLIERK